jgi:hypothetical protein
MLIAGGEKNELTIMIGAENCPINIGAYDECDQRQGERVEAEAARQARGMGGRFFDRRSPA